MSKTGKKDGVKVGDKTFKSGLIHKTGDEKTAQGFDDSITQEMNDLEQGTSIYDDGTRNTHVDTKDDQRTSEKLKYEPASSPDDFKDSKVTEAVLDEAIRKALADNPPSYLQLNHLVFEIPPEQISIQHQIKNVSMGVLRSSSTQKVRTGHGFIQVSFPLTFISRSAVNTELVDLLYMLRKSPFCWVHNEYLRKVLLPENVKDPMMLTLQSISVQSVPSLPTTFQAVLQMLWFNYKPYAKTIQYRKYYNLDEKMQPMAFGPEFNIPEIENVYADALGAFLDSPEGVSIKSSIVKFREHLDAIRAEPDPDKQKRLYDYLQEKESNPQLSLPWYEFIRGSERNQLTSNEFGPNLSPDRSFRMAWKEWGSPGKSPVDKTWKLEDENYQVYSKLRYFNSNSEFVPIHVSVQYAHRIASLSLLSHQLPTHQYLGPTDREFTVTFHATKAGKIMLEKFQKEIELFEQNVIDYRALAHNAWMEIKTPLAKAAGFPRGSFGHKMVPEHIDIETVPGNPANSIVRVTFSEYNPSIFQEDESPLDKEDKVITAFIQAVFNKLSGGNPKNIIHTYSNMRHTGGEGSWGEEFELPVGETSLDIKNIDSQKSPWVELRLGLTKNQANFKGMAALWECADEIISTTRRENRNGAIAFAYATDEETYGLKSLAEMSLLWGGNMLDQEKLGIEANQLKGDIRDIALKHLTGQVGKAFPTLAIEYAQVNLDLNSCYPDMDLPAHPVTGRVIDTEPDFFWVDQELWSEADSRAEAFAREDIMPAVKKIVKANAQTDLDLENKKPVDIVEKEAEVYAQQGIVSMDGLPDLDYTSGDLKPQSLDVIGKLVANITEDSILDAGLASVRRDTRLGMKKAFPTFRLYFIKESRDQVTYSNFYEAQGGFAVKDISVVRDRNIPADMLMINMVNLDGFLETNVIDDIRQEEFQAEQTRYVADNELYEQYEQIIKNQLQIANSKYGTNIKAETINEIIEQVNANPPAGGYGAMGITNDHAELVDGKTYSSDALKDSVTNIRIGADAICLYAAQMAKYQDEPRFEEVVASMYRFPKRDTDIVVAAGDNYLQNGTITFEWSQAIRSTELNEYVEEFRPQGSSESYTRRQQLDEDIKKTEKDLVSAMAEKERFKRVQGITPTPLPKSVQDREQAKSKQKVEDLKEKLVTLRRDRESTAVRTAVTEGIIFKEGTDVVLKMGYSNNPENLETVFIGEITEAAPGPGILQIVAQSFATELLQDIKGVPEQNAVLKGDVRPAQVSNWILSYPEVKHFGRWEDSWEIREDERNIRGVWYKKWNWTNNPSDDNVYLDDDYIGEHTLNGRTLWQGLQDLCFLYPGFVMGTRPYRDLDRNGRRRWRNTFFMGKPDASYLWWVPDDWNTLISEVEELYHDTYTRSGLDVGADVQLDLNTKEIQKDLDNLNARKKFLESVRYEPFRRYHFLSSYHNMIDNGIIMTKRGIHNAVRLNSMRRKKGFPFGREKDEYEDIVERKLEGMDDENVNWLYVENDNAWGHRAQKMATSILLWSLRDIYQGEITILGDATIRPYDVCFINDLYNDFQGPIEVGRVIHTFSEETGFITQIKPDLFTSIGEMAQRTAMGAIGAYSYRWLLNRMGIGWYDEANSEISQAHRYANEIVRGVTAGVGLTTVAALTLIYPLFMGPVLLGAYFLGKYIKNHATIRIVPLMHKGYPFVTGLEGFEAPSSSNVLLNKYRQLRKGISEGVDAVSDLYLHLRTKRGRRAVFRKMFGL